MREQSSDSFRTFSSGWHCYAGNILIVGIGVTGCMMCQLTDGLDISVRFAIEWGMWLHHS
jgi:hypothetical protein